MKKKNFKKCRATESIRPLGRIDSARKFEILHNCRIDSDESRIDSVRKSGFLHNCRIDSDKFWIDSVHKTWALELTESIRPGAESIRACDFAKKWLWSLGLHFLPKPKFLQTKLIYQHYKNIKDAIDHLKTSRIILGVNQNPKHIIKP